MENAPVTAFTFRSPVPGADPEVWARYVKWGQEVYAPMCSKLPMVKAIDVYYSVGQRPDYPYYGSIMHFDNSKDAENYRKTTERQAIEGEIAAWTKRGIVDYFWRVHYALMRNLGSEALPSLKEGEESENAPIIHLEAYNFSPRDGEKYEKWLNDFGFGVFLPLFVTLPGLQRFDCYKCLDQGGSAEVRENNYPLYLSILYFENIKSFDNYARSAELVVFLKALRNAFTRLPVHKWYVQYQMVKSFRK